LAAQHSSRDDCSCSCAGALPPSSGSTPAATNTLKGARNDRRNPIACSLDASELQQRLNAIAEIGADSLIGRSTDGYRHLLRFSSDAEARRRLQAIVVAEEKCCSFLDLLLEEDRDELVLTISAPKDRQPVADELATTFALHERD
jgi:hypothetical protein